MSLSFSVEVYRAAGVVHVSHGGGIAPRDPQKAAVLRAGSKRGVITCFSDKSMRRLLFAANNARVEWCGYGVSTYPAEFPRDGGQVKRDVDVFCKAYVREIGGHNLWAIEFQKRGAPHINFLFDEFVPKDWFSETWFRIVGSGDEKHLRAGTKIESVTSREECIGYMASRYLAKREQKEVPADFQNVGRYWGMSRGILQPVREVKLVEREDGLMLIRALRKYIEKNLKVVRVQPERDGIPRRRAVRRRRTKFLHQPRLQGVSCYKGAEIVERLLDVAAARAAEES